MSDKKLLYTVPLEELLEAGSHFGHQAKRWNPKMARYIWQAKEGIHIFDLLKTQELLRQACLVVQDLVSRDEKICFIGTKRQAQAIIKETAEKIDMPYVVSRWLGGTITNWEMIKKSIDRLVSMREKKAAGDFAKYTKKENVLLDREIKRLSRFLEGLVGLKKPPEALFVVDIKRETAAVREARNRGITIIAIVDSNTDPDLVDYPIPANDDALRSIKLITGKISEAVEAGQKIAKEKSKK